MDITPARLFNDEETYWEEFMTGAMNGRPIPMLSQHMRMSMGPYKPKTIQEFDSYDFLKQYSQIYNQFPANVQQPNPYSNHAQFIIETLSSLDIKFKVEVFPYQNNLSSWAIDNNTHRLINIIAEPTPDITCPALLFCAHHDVNNVRSNNCQDNGASVCNLLSLISLIKNSRELNHKRVIVLFSDCEEFGAKGANHFAKQSKYDKDQNIIIHDVYGEISGVINLELTGHGDVIWTDCGNNEEDMILHAELENIIGKTLPKFNTPPSDAIAFRKNLFPTLCIGTLKEDDLEHKSTWHICHSMNDTIDLCDAEDMKEFVKTLHDITKIKP